MLIWLSFAAPHKPRGQQFLGVCIVEVSDTIIGQKNVFAAALKKAWDLEINPGGEAVMTSVNPDAYPPEFRDRLLSKDELEAKDLGESMRV